MDGHARNTLDSMPGWYFFIISGDEIVFGEGVDHELLNSDAIAGGGNIVVCICCGVFAMRDVIDFVQESFIPWDIGTGL